MGCGNKAIDFAQGNARVKTNYSFSPRSRAPGHVFVMHKGQQQPDDKVDKANCGQKYRQFPGNFRHV